MKMRSCNKGLVNIWNSFVSTESIALLICIFRISSSLPACSDLSREIPIELKLVNCSGKRKNWNHLRTIRQFTQCNLIVLHISPNPSIWQFSLVCPPQEFPLQMCELVNFRESFKGLRGCDSSMTKLWNILVDRKKERIRNEFYNAIIKSIGFTLFILSEVHFCRCH